LYGPNSPEFFLARYGIFKVWKGFIARIIQKLYLTFGEAVAKLVKRSSLLKYLFRPLFDRAVQLAIKDLTRN
jgi:hypothetical protein